MERENTYFRFGVETHITHWVEITAVLVQYHKAEIFQVGKRNIQNQKMIDNWGNAKIALPRAC
jgi:3-deoxy-D-arabino-heptulosonate 7-phosphate (DAHP) synthase